MKTKINTSRAWGVRKSLALALLVFLILVTGVAGLIPSTHAATGINSQLNFQGRLSDNTGAIVPDGTYNMEFNIYQDGDGQTALDATGLPAGALKWTEDYKQTNRVIVKNGYFSVQLGSLCAFSGGSCQGNTNVGIDWNQSTLWLSINIGGTANTASPTWDGEMLPMKQLTATPYALNAAALGGLTASGFVQNSLSLQPGTTNFNISGTGTANLLQAANLDAATSGALGIGNNGNATSVSICNSANCDTVNIGTNADADTINIGDSSDTVGILGAVSINTTGTDGTSIGNSTGAITLAGNTTSSGNIQGTTLNGTTGVNTGASGGTQRINSSGNLVNIGSLTTTGGSTFSIGGGSSILTINSLDFTATSSGINSTAIGAGGTASTGAFTTLTSGAHTVTSSSANALAVGANGTTNPALNVDASTASSTTGLNIKAAANGGGLALSALSGQANEALTLSAKGTGALTLASGSTGNVQFFSSSNSISSSGALTLVGGITAATSGTINGISINSGAVSGVSSLGLSGAISGATSGNTINGLIINSGALSGISTISASGQITSTLLTGTAPLVVASTTNVANLNASLLNGFTFANPGAIGGGTAGTGAFTTLSSGAHTITSSSANALAVGLAGATNPAFNVDASTALSVTGLNIKSAVAGSGLALTTTSTGTNEALTLSSKGSGALTLNSGLTGNVQFFSSSNSVSSAGALTLAGGITAATSGTINGLNINSGAISGATTLNLSGAITGATSTNTINGLIINSGALSGISTVNASGAITAATTGTINGLNISSGALSGISTIGLSGAISGATSTNTINGLIINSGALSGISTINASGAITAATSGTINGLSINSGSLSGITTFSQSQTVNTNDIFALTNTGLTTTGNDLANFTFKNNNGSGVSTINGLTITEQAANAGGTNTSNLLNLVAGAGGTVNGLNFGANLTNYFTNSAGTTKLDASGNLTLAGGLTCTNCVSNGDLRQSGATSLIGRSANSTGNVADISASADNQVLYRSGGALTFGTLPNAALQNSTIGLTLGTSGTDANVSGSPASLGGAITLNIPDAGTGARGLVTTGTQSFAGNKTFSGTVAIQAASSAALQVQNGANILLDADTSGNQLKVFDGIGGTGYATISFNSSGSGTAIFAASSGATTQVGSGVGPISFSTTSANISLTTATSGSISATAVGALTLQGGATSTWSVAGTNQSLNIQTSGTGTLGLDTTGAGTAEFGNSHATTVALGNTTAATQTTINGGTGTSAISLTQGSGGKITVGSTTGSANVALQSGTGNITLTTNGGSAGVIVKSATTDSPTAFEVQDSTAAPFFTVDTNSGNLVQIGTTTGGANSVILVLDTYDNSGAAGDPTGVNGAMYYNDFSNTFRCRENGVWKNCIASPSNASVADQTTPANATTYLTGSNFTVPASGLQVGTQIIWHISMTKTAAGTAASSFLVKYGTAGTTGDATELTFTGPAEAAQTDTAQVQIIVTVRSVNASTGAWTGNVIMGHSANPNQGFINAGGGVTQWVATTTSGSFNDTTANAVIGLALSAGAADAFTFQQVQVSTVNL